MEIQISNYNQTKSVFYEVKCNQSIDEIATQLRVPKDYITKNNSGQIYEGKVLFIPQTNLKSHVVKPFETIETISKKYGITVEEIMSKNSLKSNYIFIGQKLYL